MGHFGSAGGSLESGDADDLVLSVAQLDAAVHQYRDAELALADVDDSAVLIVTPTGMATGCALGQHTLTAIPRESLPHAVRRELDTALGDSLESFEFVQIGRSADGSSNRSLTEFQGA